MTLTADVLRPHQRRIIGTFNRGATQGKRVVIAGGRGVGKTAALVAALWARMLLLTSCYRGVRLAVIATKYQQLHDTFMVEWGKQADAGDYTYHTKGEWIELPNDGAILLRHAGTGEGKSAETAALGFRGQNLCGLYAPEAISLPARFLSDAVLAVRGAPTPLHPDRPETHVPYRIICLDCNPSGPWHPIFQEYFNRDGDSYLGDDRILTMSIPTTPETSFYDPDVLADMQRSLAPHQKARLIDALWVGAEKAIYSDVQVCDPVNPADLVRYWIGHDPGTMRAEDGNTGNLAYIVLGQKQDGRFVVCDERLTGYIGTASIVEPVRALMQRWGPGKLVSVVRDWTGLGKLSRDLLKDQLSVVVESPAHDQGRYFPVKVGIAMLIESFRSGRIQVAKDCIRTLRDTQLYVWDERGEEPDKRAHDPHLLDALRYLWIRVSRTA